MRLEINGIEADLGASIIAITRKSIDISNLSLRNIDISNRLNLPKTNINKEIFGSSDRIYADSNGLGVTYTAKIIDQDIIFNGIGYLTETNTEFQFQLVEASKSVLDNLNNNINAFGWDAYDFTFSDTEYDNHKLITDSVWVWPIVAMNISKTEDRTRFESGNNGLKYSRPCFNFNNILTDSIEAQGWEIEMDTDIIDQLAISSNAKKFYLTNYQKTFDDSFNVSGSYSLTGFATSDFIYGVFTGATYIQTTDDKLIVRLRGDVVAESDFRVEITSQSQGTGDEQTEVFDITSDTTEIDFKTRPFSPTSPDTTIRISVTITGTGSLTFSDVLFYTLIEENDLGDLSTNPLLNYRVKAYDNMPKVKQVDLLKDAMIITNSILEPDSLNKVMRLRSLKNLNKLNSYDWSEKLDLENYTITNKLSGYAQKSNLVYNNDDTVPEALGSDFFTMENESLPDVEDVLGLDWGASPEVQVENNTDYPVASFDIYNDEERENTVNDRLIYIYNDDTNTFTLGGFAQIDWKSLKAAYHENWLSSFNRLRLVTGEADLNQLDVIGHDFLKLVYVEGMKSTFFVQSIEDFVPGQKTKVELIKFL